jgi:hypothetical protein
VDVVGWLFFGGPLWVYALRPIYVEVSATEEIAAIATLLLLPTVVSALVRRPASASGAAAPGAAAEPDADADTPGAGGGAVRGRGGMGEMMWAEGSECDR